MIWALRVCWFGLAVVAGPAVGDALADRSRAVQVTFSVGAWLAWGVVLSCTLLPRTVTLTIVRVIAPGAVVLAGYAAVDAARPGWAAAAVGAAVLSVGVAFHSSVGDVFADGSSYGEERRVLLRVPTTLLVGPIPIAWAVLAASVVGGVGFLATGQWIPGLAVTAVAAAAAWHVGRRLHQLARRWIVFVPAGIVVHDPMTVGEPLLLTRALIDRFGPAPAAAPDRTDALDLTAGALGLVLELRSRQPIDVLVVRGRTTALLHNVDAVLVAPTRPGTALTIAADRRLPVA